MFHFLSYSLILGIFPRDPAYPFDSKCVFKLVIHTTYPKNILCQVGNVVSQAKTCIILKVLCIQVKARFIDTCQRINCIIKCIHGNIPCQTAIKVYKSCIFRFYEGKFRTFSSQSHSNLLPECKHKDKALQNKVHSLC